MAKQNEKQQNDSSLKLQSRKERLSSTNPIKNRGWSRALQKRKHHISYFSNYLRWRRFKCAIILHVIISSITNKKWFSKPFCIYLLNLVLMITFHNTLIANKTIIHISNILGFCLLIFIIFSCLNKHYCFFG